MTEPLTAKSLTAALNRAIEAGGEDMVGVATPGYPTIATMAFFRKQPTLDRAKYIGMVQPEHGGFVFIPFYGDKTYGPGRAEDAVIAHREEIEALERLGRDARTYGFRLVRDDPREEKPAE